MASMMALRARVRGGPEVLEIDTVERPLPADAEVLVEVHAAAITFAELTWDETWTRDGVDRTPVTPSHEFSGVVLARGANAAEHAVGDSVYGLVPFDRDGAAAQCVVAPVGSIARKPRTVSHAVAAAVALPALTAWQALNHARIGAGDRLLVLGGAGGVGAYVTQLAVARKAQVTATVLSADIEHVRALGAVRVIDVTAEQFDVEHGVFDAVIDTVGGSTLDRAYAVVRPGGRLVTLQAPPSAETAVELGIEAIFFVVTADAAQLAQIADLIDDGHLRATIAATFPLADGRRAYESGSTLQRPPGKTVLTVHPDAETEPVASVS